MILTGSVWHRPWYWVMEEKYDCFGDARREARAEADHRDRPVPIRATWRTGNNANATHGLRIACVVQPTAVVLENVERVPQLRRPS